MESENNDYMKAALCQIKEENQHNSAWTREDQSQASTTLREAFDIIGYFSFLGKFKVHWCPRAFYNKDLQMAVLCFIGYNLFLQFRHTALKN